jgi:hypothetical protein
VQARRIIPEDMVSVPRRAENGTDADAFPANQACQASVDLA